MSSKYNDTVIAIGGNDVQLLRNAGLRHPKNLRSDQVIKNALVIPYTPADHVLKSMEAYWDSAMRARVSHQIARLPHDESEYYRAKNVYDNAFYHSTLWNNAG